VTITIKTVGEFKANVKDMTAQGRERVTKKADKETSYSPLTQALKKVWHTYKFGDAWRSTGALYSALAANEGDEGVEFECGETKPKHNYKVGSLIRVLNEDGTEAEPVIVTDKSVNGPAIGIMDAKGKHKVTNITTEMWWRYATAEETEDFLAKLDDEKVEDYLDTVHC
jgi:hypothetical protein